MSSVRSEIRIPSGAIELEALFESPPVPRGIVVFAHGSASSRHSSRSQFLARSLWLHGFASLVVDLLDADDCGGRRPDLDVFEARLRRAVRWVRSTHAASPLPIGLCGAGAGSTAAFQLAAALGPRIAAVVSRGARGNFAPAEVMRRVQAPTLLIVPGREPGALALHEEAWEQLQGPKSMHIVPCAAHALDDPEPLAIAAEQAARWFERHMTPRDPRSSPPPERRYAKPARFT
jgi:putative phosphoribosyl transferase